MDVLPTISSIVNNEEDTKDGVRNKLDGVSMLGLLKSKSDTREREKMNGRIVYHFCDSEIFAMRTQVDGVIFKMILKEPLLTLSGSCQGICCFVCQLF